MIERTFSQDDLTAFARLSGDFNPLHVDPLQARRLLFNTTVAHGISLLLWGLECALGRRSDTIRIEHVRCKFLKPVRVDERVACIVNAKDERGLEIEIGKSHETCARIEALWTPASSAVHGSAAEELAEGDPARQACQVHALTDLGRLNGRVPLHLDAGRLAALYPALPGRLPPVQIAQLLATTRVVGMECPGLHSVYSALSLDLAGGEGPRGALEYEVAAADERMGRVEIAVRSASAQGRLVAYLRPPAVGQADLATLATLVAKREFETQKALVVGGSRGIGAVVARLLAGGGAQVHITFHQGREEAQGLVREIEAFGGRASASPLDVLHLARGAFGELAPTHVYYFATPPIFVGSHKAFSPAVFQRFCDFYVGGLANVLAQVMGPDLRGVLFPSSVAIEELPANMGEYVAAKAAGEAFCRLLERWHPELAVACPRLPRTRTDQTASLLHDAAPAPQEVVLEHLRRLDAATRQLGSGA